MKSIHDFVVEPIGDRYNNIKKIDGDELILNTEVFNHQYSNRMARVKSVPILEETDIKVDDIIVIHHNVFRRWHNIRGKEKNSRSYFDENNYLVNKEQIFLYKRNNDWIAPKGYCFVQPLKNKDIFSLDTEKPLMGKVIYTDGTVNIGDFVGFRPNSEYEFIIDGQRLYRVLSNLITIKYEYQENEETYNPSWAQSG